MVGGRIRGFLSLPVGDKLRLSLAAGLLLVVWGGVVAVPFDRFRSALVRVGRAAAIPGAPDASRVANAVDAADRTLPGDRTCLVRSLATEALLLAYDHSVDHRIGVHRTDGGVEAHSWIEHDGEILLGDLADLEKYERLPALDGGHDAI